MVLYTENLRDITRKLLEFINEFGKVAGYKINTKKPVEFLYTNKELDFPGGSDGKVSAYNASYILRVSGEKDIDTQHNHKKSNDLLFLLEMFNC